MSDERGVGYALGAKFIEPHYLSGTNDFLLQPGVMLAIKLDLHELVGDGRRNRGCRLRNRVRMCTH